VLNGANGNDVINGRADNDRCDGGSGNNTITNCESERRMAEEPDEDEEQKMRAKNKFRQ